MWGYFCKTASTIWILLLSIALRGQTMDFEAYDPPSTLVVPEHILTRAKFPFVDVHNHQWNLPNQDLAELIAQMDSLNMAVMVNLSGRGFRRIENPDGSTRFALNGSDFLKAGVENVRQHAPGRIIVFTNIDFHGLDGGEWVAKTVRQLEEDVRNGAKGLKVYKSLGMFTVDSEGRRVPVDDPRLDPIWAKCGELGIPLLIHTADPAPFWQPHDSLNERWLELKQRPERKRDPATEPGWEQLIREQHHVFRKHPGTIFINAHLGWMGNDLARLGRLFDELPNVYTEIGAVLAELGRQPHFARKWLLRYQDRVLFGKDAWAPEEYHVYFRVLETDDDYIKYYRRRHAFWRLYGLNLPDEVLKKIYFQNALKIIPGIDPAIFPR